MKRFLTIIAATLLPVLALAQSAAPRDVAAPETISVTGTGRSSVTPDRFTFTAGVTTVAPTVDDAVNQNNARVASVIAALKKAGATDKEIRTSNFSIWPQQEYVQGKMPQILGYQVSNTITVTRDKIGEAGRLLQVAISAGVNQSSGLQFEVSDPTKGRDLGLGAAFEDARNKATLLAKAAGRTLGKALAITEGTQAYMPPHQGRVMSMKAEAASAVSDVPVESGMEEQTYTVSVVFLLL